MPSVNGKRPIFVVEDSDDDFELLQQLFSSAKVAAPLERAVSGNAAITHFSGVTTPEAAPALVLTDLTMPDGDGFEFLTWAHAQPSFRDTLLVILSSTRRGADIDRAYSLGAHFFLSKFPTSPMLAALCLAAEKKELELRARLASFHGEPALSR